MVRPDTHEVRPDLAVFLDGGYHGLDTAAFSAAQLTRDTLDMGESLRTLFSSGQIAEASRQPIANYGFTKTSDYIDIGYHHGSPVAASVDLSTSYRHVLETDSQGNPSVLPSIRRLPDIPVVIAIGATVEAENGTFAVSLSTIGGSYDKLPSLHRVRWNPELVELNRFKFVRVVLAGCIDNLP